MGADESGLDSSDLSGLCPQRTCAKPHLRRSTSSDCRAPPYCGRCQGDGVLTWRTGGRERHSVLIVIVFIGRYPILETKRAVAIQGQANLFSEGPSQKARSLGRGIERQFDVAFVSGLALREKQIQQNYRPIIAVHKWFARRPGTLFRALLLSEFVEGTLQETFYKSHDLAGIQIADPFMGGGTPLLEANRLGCSVFGYDINPMAYWVVKQEIEELDLRKYREAAAEIGQLLGSGLIPSREG